MGLAQFTDMAKVFPVNPELLTRTQAWILARRDGKGGFLRNPKALDSFGSAPPDVTDAYITWALTYAGVTGLEAEVESLQARAEASLDAYVLALAAGSLFNIGRETAGERLLTRLADYQQSDGRVTQAKTTITCSGSDSLEIETTALTALAWMAAGAAYTAQIERAMVRA
jgi:hypothetical protein